MPFLIVKSSVSVALKKPHHAPCTQRLGADGTRGPVRGGRWDGSEEEVGWVSDQEIRPTTARWERGEGRRCELEARGPGTAWSESGSAEP